MKILTSTNTKKQTNSFYKNIPQNIVCFSHLRWDFVFQRPQHLLTRFSQSFRIFFIEEPIFDTTGEAYYSYLDRGDNIKLVVPHLPHGLSAEEVTLQLKNLLDMFMENKNLADFTFWYYTPMALEFSRKHLPEMVIYDCMDELSAFKFAPESLKNLEKELLKRADVVFTGGQSLYEAKKNQHSNIHPFPSSIDKKHFGLARKLTEKPADQPYDGKLKLGFYGVIDERFDIELIRGIADARPEWNIMLIGPVVKIDEATLPKNANIHYLGSKNYQELPSYLATWDIALIPFMLNESTKFISPTKTPEYLAAGVPVVSTPIRDVVNPYGKNKLVSIAHDSEGFVAAIDDILQNLEKDAWQKTVDNFLSENSWDHTCSRMLNLVKETIAGRSLASIAQ